MPTLNRDIFKNLRSPVLERRPLPADVQDGEIAINSHTESVGLFVRDTLGKIRKVGPAHIGTTPPTPNNYTELSGGELWIDTSAPEPVVKFYDEQLSIWVSSSGLYDSGLQTDNIIVGNEDGISEAYLLNPESFAVEHDDGLENVRITDSPKFGSYGFVSESGTEVNVKVFSGLVVDGDDDWHELNSYDKTLYRNGKYVVEVLTDTGDIAVTEFLICHNGTDTFYTEYGSVGSVTDPLVDFRAVVVTDNISLQVRRVVGVTGDITIRSLQTSLF